MREETPEAFILRDVFKRRKVSHRTRDVHSFLEKRALLGSLAYPNPFQKRY
jgi:hypothetical protein